MTEKEMVFFTDRFDCFESKLDSVITVVSELKSEQKYCPAHGKSELTTVISKANEVQDVNREVKKFIATSFYGLFFSAIGVIITLVLTGVIKI
jgi:hypothetical protein